MLSWSIRTQSKTGEGELKHRPTTKKINKFLEQKNKVKRKQPKDENGPKY
jgi:hypothetical protein